MTFQELRIIPPILQELTNEKYEQPTPIQEAAIPAILDGRDILASAQTGTGKTAAFAVPTLQLLNKDISYQQDKKRPIRSLILTPTRELALQIYENYCSYSRGLKIRTVVIFGGVPQKPQEKDLAGDVDILVATPGRLLDLIKQGFINLRQVEILILDEADRMLDMGFIHDVKKILNYTPEKKQTLLFSATMPPQVADLASSLLIDPYRIEIEPETTTVEAIEQSLYFVDKANKRKLLRDLLQTLDIESALVFTRTKHGADRIVKELDRKGIKAIAIHGNKSQNARVRALNAFKKRQVRVLVATDIAARGLDIDNLSHVFNFDLPEIPESYVHRIGRTGRAGKTGIAIAFCDIEERKLLRDIERFIGTEIPVVKEHNYPAVSVIAKPKQAKGGQNKTSSGSKSYNKQKNRGGSYSRSNNQRKSGSKQRVSGKTRSANWK
ncbi:MAG: DEAD/DEAH box helicase [Clostridiaceae bacterium]|nr:DEAD/DEAH box helicase [Clostridiaceae bacterium]